MIHVAPTTESSRTASAHEPQKRDRLLSITFVGLLLTQFLGTTNDNILRWLVIGIGKEYVPKDEISTVLAFGSACFVLPYILLAAPAGYLADRFSKRDVIAHCKIAEIVIMAAATGAILIGNIYLMFVIVALAGSQAALFGPAKLGSIPEMLRANKISSANGLIGLSTVIATVVGAAVGNWLRKSPANSAANAGGFPPWCWSAWPSSAG
jgi:acyl-[acyl-carrier-protein]-phospholipid O-acyltransferase/long-chain-fatty-acid--[acyl-carrier-protein] ligase